MTTTETTVTTTVTSLVFDPESSTIETRLAAPSSECIKNKSRNERLSATDESCSMTEAISGGVGNIFENPGNVEDERGKSRYVDKGGGGEEGGGGRDGDGIGRIVAEAEKRAFMETRGLDYYDEDEDDTLKRKKFLWKRVERRET